MNIGKKDKKKKISNIILIIVPLFFLIVFVYSLIPKISAGNIKGICFLRERYTLYNIPVFKTNGDLFFIEESYFLSHKIVVFGKLGNKNDLFNKIKNQKEFNSFRQKSFYLPDFVKKFEKIFYYKYNVKRLSSLDNYIFVNNDFQTGIQSYFFIIMGSRYSIMIDSANDFFVLVIVTR